MNPVNPLWRQPFALVAILLAGMSAAQSHPAADPNDWEVAELVDGAGAYTATMAATGEVLGRYCFSSTGECTWMVLASTPCREDSEVLLTITGRSGQLLVQRELLTVCKDLVERKAYVFCDSRSLEQLVSVSSVVTVQGRFAGPVPAQTLGPLAFSTAGVVPSLRQLDRRFPARGAPARGPLL